jgi:uncharacterized linocin/CFP29 family protein
MQAAKPKMLLWNDLRTMAPPYVIQNGMNFSVLTHQRTGIPGRAGFSMDGLTRGPQERRTFDLAGLPLPIVSKEFSLTAREIAVSRQMGTDLDTAGAADAAISCAEEVERLTTGTSGAFAYGGYSIYGYTNFPSRLTGSLTNPTTGGWTPNTLRNEVLAMLQALNNAWHTGPYRVYYSVPFLQYMARRYSDYEAMSTIEVLQKLPRVSSVQQADYLSTGYRIVIVEENQTVAQAVVGMELQTIQWEEHGGMELCFMVMGILVPRIRADKLGQTGIADYVAA